MGMEKYLSDIKKYKFIAWIFLFLSISIYVVLTIVKADGIINTDLGPVGDFFGGILNPIFALIGLFALFKTIELQSKELNLATEEMKKSNEIFTEQSKSIKKQNFENTFFNMFNQYNQIVDNLLLEKEYKINPLLQGEEYFKYKISNEEINLYADKEYKSRQVISQLLIIFKTYKKNHENESFQMIYRNFHIEYQELLSHYFGYIYQVLKFIKDNENEIDSVRKYASIFRSQFSVSALELLYYHCASTYGMIKFSVLLIEFEFLEHLPYDDNIDKKLLTIYFQKTRKLDKKYPIYKVFGKNIKWIEELKNY